MLRRSVFDRLCHSLALGQFFDLPLDAPPKPQEVRLVAVQRGGHIIASLLHISDDDLVRRGILGEAGDFKIEVKASEALNACQPPLCLCKLFGEERLLGVRKVDLVLIVAEDAEKSLAIFMGKDDIP